MRIDKPVESLVRKMNRIKGVYPRSSCGGHKNPKGSRCPTDEFFIIMNIENKDFLKKFKRLTSQWKCNSIFEYHPIHETWCLNGTHDVKDLLYEPWIECYLDSEDTNKPVEEWDMFMQIDSRETIRIPEHNKNIS